jgi:hypothetical protein
MFSVMLKLGSITNMRLVWVVRNLNTLTKWWGVQSLNNSRTHYIAKMSFSQWWKKCAKLLATASVAMWKDKSGKSLCLHIFSDNKVIMHLININSIHAYTVIHHDKDRDWIGYVIYVKRKYLSKLTTRGSKAIQKSFNYLVRVWFYPLK